MREDVVEGAEYYECRRQNGKTPHPPWQDNRVHANVKPHKDVFYPRRGYCAGYCGPADL